ncbi:hypothetical protein HDU81_002123 [Chytriomyces hyalinus]|nr:hypothetical protein HDU81_002123 [Chytriomyces hyalinus]
MNITTFTVDYFNTYKEATVSPAHWLRTMVSTYGVRYLGCEDKKLLLGRFTTGFSKKYGRSYDMSRGNRVEFESALMNYQQQQIVLDSNSDLIGPISTVVSRDFVKGFQMLDKDEPCVQSRTNIGIDCFSAEGDNEQDELDEQAKTSACLVEFKEEVSVVSIKRRHSRDFIKVVNILFWLLQQSLMLLF